MARALTKKQLDGTPWTRDDDVEKSIDEALALEIEELRLRVVLPKNAAGHLKTEVLVHLVREAMRADNKPLLNVALPALLLRCRRTLCGRIPDRVANAEQRRGDILAKLSALFVEEHAGNNVEKLDFWECRFNGGFLRFLIDEQRVEQRHQKRYALAEEEATISAEDDAEPSTGETWTFDPEKLDVAKERRRVAAALDKLPEDQREAVVLKHILELEEESKDPNNKTTIAAVLGVTGRTVRNRVARGMEKLEKLLKEEP